MKLSPSYISYILPLLILINYELAKLFYPYVFSCSVIGIFIALLVMFNNKINNYFERKFPNNITFQFEEYIYIYYPLNLLILIIKLLLIKYYPYEFSIKSILYSIILFLTYLLYYYLV